MTEPDDTAPHVGIDRLAEAVSAQAKATARMWLATLTVALVVLLPRQPAPLSGPDEVSLPFQLGDVPSTVFYPLVFAILAVFCTALASAHAQHMRVHRLAHGVVDHLVSQHSPSQGTLHPRDQLDMMTQSGLTRVAPLAQWVRGPYQFAANEAAAPLPLRLLSTVYYLLLKLLVFAVLYALPGLALWHGYQRMADATTGWALGLLTAAGLVAGASLAIVAFGELAYVKRVAALLWRKSHSQPTSAPAT